MTSQHGEAFLIFPFDGNLTDFLSLPPPKNCSFVYQNATKTVEIEFTRVRDEDLSPKAVEKTLKKSLVQEELPRILKALTEFSIFFY